MFSISYESCLIKAGSQSCKRLKAKLALSAFEQSIYIWKAEPMLVSLLPLMYTVPGIMLSQAAGILADRMNKLNIMIYTDVIRCFFTAGLLMAPSPYWMLLILLFRSIAGVFHLPAQQALLRCIVKDEHVLKATTLNGTVFQLAKVFGPITGAALLCLTS